MDDNNVSPKTAQRVTFDVPLALWECMTFSTRQYDSEKGWVFLPFSRSSYKICFLQLLANWTGQSKAKRAESKFDKSPITGVWSQNAALWCIIILRRSSFQVNLMINYLYIQKSNTLYGGRSSWKKNVFCCYLVIWCQKHRQ